MTWMDDAAAEIDNVEPRHGYGKSFAPRPATSAIIARHYERHVATAVPVDLARLLDEAQAELRRLEGEVDTFQKRIRDLERELCYKIGGDK